MGMISWTIAGLIWIGFAAFTESVRRRSLRDGDPRTGLALVLLRMFVRVVHRLRVSGAEHALAGRAAGPMVVVANHTSSVDPLLIQSACPFEIRWLMAEDMRTRRLEPMLDWAGVIAVDRRTGSGAGLRPALRALRAGEVVGVFPEGGIARAGAGRLSFQIGVGVLIARSGARALPICISGTPAARSVWAGIVTPSRSRLTIGEPIEFPPDAEPGDIVRALEDRIGSLSGAGGERKD